MSILVAVLGLALLIFILEGGHFLVALAVRMRPRSFNVGFGPPLLKIRRQGVEYAIRSIPLGGYVKIPGMHRAAPADMDAYFGRAVQAAPSLVGPSERLKRALAAGAETVVGLVLAPHYSRLSIGGYRDQLEQALAGRARLVFVESWHDDPAFVQLLAERVRGTQAHVVFTAHSLPARILEEGDPYEEQLLRTSSLVAEAAGLARWSFSYQSQSETGEPWLEPDLLDHLEELAEKGVRSVLVCPVGFVSDHLEIRFDIDVEAQARARELGMCLERIAMPNAEPSFVRALAGIARQALALPSVP